MVWGFAAVIIVFIVVLSAISALYLLVLRLTYSTEDENPSQQIDESDSDPEPDFLQDVAPTLSPISPAEDVDRFLFQSVSPDHLFSNEPSFFTPVVLEALNELHGEIGKQGSVNAAVVNTSNLSPKGSTMAQWHYMKDGLAAR